MREEREYTQFVIEMLDKIPSNKHLAALVKDEFSLTEPTERIRRNVSNIRSRNTFNLDKPIKRLFFDIETSPNIGLFWRTGWKNTNAPAHIIEERKIICISYKWSYEDKVQTITWDKNQCDKKMLEKFTKVMLKADEVVAHNGDRFDEKWIRTRCLFHRIPALPKYKSLDTLKKVKRHFNFQSNTLAYIANFVGVEAKGDPGGLDTWKAIMFEKCPEAMARMVEYCEKDVRVLEEVYSAINSYIYNNTNFAVLKGGYKHDCPECGSPKVKLVKDQSTTAGTIHKIMECTSCEKNYKINAKTYKDFVHHQTIDQ